MAGALGPRGDFLRAQAWLAPVGSVPEVTLLFRGWASFHVHAMEQYCSPPPGQVVGAASTGALHVALPRHKGLRGDAEDVWALRVEVYGGHAAGPGAREALEAESEGTGPLLVLDGEPYAVDWSLMSGAVSGKLADLEKSVTEGAQKEKRKRRRGKRRGARGAGKGVGTGGRDVPVKAGEEVLKAGEDPGEAAVHYVTLLFPHVCLNLFCRRAEGGAARDLWHLQVEGLERVLKDAVACKEKMAEAAHAGRRAPVSSLPEAVGDLNCDADRAAAQEAPELFDAWMELLDLMTKVEPDMPLQDVWSLLSAAADLRRRAETTRIPSRVSELEAQGDVHRATQIILADGPDHSGGCEESFVLLQKALERQFQTQTNELHCALAGL